jgi:hypothetical protein
MCTCILLHARNHLVTRAYLHMSEILQLYKGGYLPRKTICQLIHAHCFGITIDEIIYLVYTCTCICTCMLMNSL